MSQNVTPMIHVSSVKDTIDWYLAVGFTVVSTGEEAGQLVWAEMSYGEGRVMFNAGGRSSLANRREVDLYVQTVGVDALFETLKPQVQVQEAIHDTFYGMREFIVRDNNGFWVTFGEPKQTPHGEQ